MRKQTEYNKDFNLWAQHQAAFLKSKEFAKLDIEHLFSGD